MLEYKSQTLILQFYALVLIFVKIVQKFNYKARFVYIFKENYINIDSQYIASIIKQNHNKMHMNIMQTEYFNKKQSLQQTLIMQLENPQKNYYVMCLSLSKQQPPNQKIINLVNTLIEKDIAINQEERWLEVLRRLAFHNYQLVFHLCSKNFYAIRAVLSEAAVYGNNQDLENLLSIVYSISTEFLLKAQQHSINSKDLQTLLSAFTTIFQSWNNRDDIMMYRFLGQFAQLPQLLKILSNQVDQEIAKINRTYNRSQQAFSLCFWQFHENLIKSFAKFQKIANRNLQMNQFINKLGILVQYIKYFIEKILENINTTMINNKFLQQHKECVIEMLKSLTNYLTLNDIQFSMVTFQKKYILVEFFAKISFARRFQNDLEDVMHGQYDLIMDQASDDFIGCLGSCLHKLVEVDGFFSQFIIALEKFKDSKMKLFNQSPPNQKKQVLFQYSEILLKICVIKKKCNNRMDLSQNFIRQLHQETADLLTMVIASQPKKMLVQITICRHLRFISFLHKLLKDDQFVKCVDTCLIILLNKNPSTILFKQSFQIISNMIQSQPSDIFKNNILDIADKFITNFSQANIVEEKVYKLLNMLLQKYSKITQKMFEKIFFFLKNNFEKELANIWNRGMKTSPSLLSMLNCIKTTIKMISDNNLLDEEQEYLAIDSTLEPILLLLQQPYKIEFEDQIISILSYMLRIANTITDTLCRACLLLNKIVIKDNYSLVNIAPVIEIISQSSMIRKEILFNFPDLVSYFLQIIESFFFNKIGKQEMSIEQMAETKKQKIFRQYLQLYPQQWRNVVEIITIFIQSYEDWFQDQNTYKVKIFYQLYEYSIKIYQQIHTMLNIFDINSSTNRILKFCIEPAIQLLLTLQHISYNHSQIDRRKLYLSDSINWETFVNFIEKCLAHNNYTIKLVIMNYCDQLVLSYEQKLLDNMMNFFINHRRCYIGKQCRRDGDWVHLDQKILQSNQNEQQAPGFLKKSKSHSDCPYFLGLSAKDLIIHTLRTLKSKRSIDDVQLAQNMQFCK